LIITTATLVPTTIGTILEDSLPPSLSLVTLLLGVIEAVMAVVKDTSEIQKIE